MRTPRTTPARRKRAILVGCGNPIRADDAVGLAVVRLIRARLRRHKGRRSARAAEVEVCESTTGGLSLLERVAGYDHAVIVDAICGAGGRVGECYCLDRRRHAARGVAGLHEAGLLESVPLARRMGLRVPAVLRVYVVAVADPCSFASTMTPAVRAAVPRAARLILRAEYGVRDPCTCAAAPAH